MYDVCVCVFKCNVMFRFWMLRNVMSCNAVYFMFVFEGCHIHMHIYIIYIYMRMCSCALKPSISPPVKGTDISLESDQMMADVSHSGSASDVD